MTRGSKMPPSLLVRARRAVGWLLVMLGVLGACRQAEELPVREPPIPVRLESVVPVPFQPSLHLLGVVEPRDSVVITAHATGPVHYPAHPDGLRSGIEVRRGQVLVRQRLPSADHQIELARLAAEAAAEELERHREAWEQGLVPATTLEAYKLRAEMTREQLRAAHEERSQLEVRAPVSGRLAVERRFPPGTEVAAGTVLAEILTEARQIHGWAGADDRRRLEVGQRVRIHLPDRDAPPVDGTLHQIAPLAKRGGAYSVVVQPQDPRQLPAPGEAVEVEVLLEGRLQALTVPEQAVVVNADGAAVFVALRSGDELRAERRAVTLGERSGDERSGQRIEVLQGLTRGDRVVVEGASLLTDGTPVVAVDAAPTDEAAAGEAMPSGSGG